jgi:hypothetical protein
MALIPCKECNETVSTEAAACPHCGAPQQRPVPPPLPVAPKEQTIYSDNAVIDVDVKNPLPTVVIGQPPANRRTDGWAERRSHAEDRHADGLFGRRQERQDGCP